MGTTISIELDLPDVNVLKQSIDVEGNLLIEVESTKTGCDCHRCQSHITQRHGLDEPRQLRHTSILGKKTYIVIRPKRYACKTCQQKLGKKVTTTEGLSWSRNYSPHTLAYERHVLKALINNTVSDVSVKEDLGYDAVEGILERHVLKEPNWEEMDKLEVIGIDDLSRRKGRSDRWTIVSRRDEQGDVHVLGVLENHTKDMVKRFFLSIPKRLRKTVKVICSDLYEGFINAAKEVFGSQVRCVADRFHVAKLYRDSVEELRKQELKQAKEELDDETYKQIKKDAMLIRRNELTDKQSERLELVFKHLPQLKLGYDLSRELTEIYNQELTIKQARA